MIRRVLITTLILSCALSSASHGAEIKVFTSRAVATVFEKIGPGFERTSGHKLNVIVDLSPNFVKRINAGESFDLLVSLPKVIDTLTTEGKLKSVGRTTLVKSETGVEVRSGVPKPDISTVEAFKQTLRNAKSVG
jgi:molybdate transport system substrate-binding protein